MTKHSIKKHKSKLKTKRNRNKKNKRSIKNNRKKNRHTRKGGINLGLKDKFTKFFNKGKTAISNVRGTGDLVTFLNGIPSYNKQVLMNKLLTLSLDDTREKLNELETQKERYINGILNGVDDKILKNHPLQLLIDKYSLTTEKIEYERTKAFNAGDEKNPKNPIVLLTNNPKTHDNISYSHQLYAEYNKDGKATINNQYVSHSAIGDPSIFIASEKEDAIKTAIKEEKTDDDDVKDRDKFGVSNKPPITRSYYVPVKSDKYSNMFKGEKIDKKDNKVKPEETEKNTGEKIDKKDNEVKPSTE